MKNKAREDVCKVAFLAAMLACSGTTLAVELKAGKWGTNSTVVVPMAQEPVTEYSEECVAEDFDPVQEMLGEMGDQCDITINEDTSTALNADMSCEVPGAGTMTGTLSFVINGDNATGSMLMSMNVGGMAMETSATFESEYLGACD